ncbi:SoxR reducing system RseC family protein [Geotoga petraea]|jgi:sigma-E factor negative regulatory protein RseC|uniref:Positive regulator of sigma(E), RseC/MucC n=1 Tax=Geotoga petraea TaxID=28234 RepID=A0A1G6IAH7_9BACT|nr:SoxR reducing system RseC family protein [Geotoga petraea]SDC03504.1 positive regulator of sigma(E), RseC/MucC [Geotoga petraea]
MRELMTVKKMDNKYVYLKTNRASECSTCSISGACSLTGTPDIELKAMREESYIPGEKVLVELPQVPLAKIAMLVYGFPLLVFLALAILSYGIGLNDLFSFSIAIGGMAVSYFILSILDKKKFKDMYLPKIIKKVKNEIKIND